MAGRPGIGGSAQSGDTRPRRRTGDDLGGAAGGAALRGLHAPRQRSTGAGLRLPGLGRAVQPGVARLPAPHRPNRACRVCPLGHVRPGLRGDYLKNAYSKDAERGNVRDITYTDVSVTGKRAPRSFFNGLDAEHAVQGVTIDNLRLNGKLTTTATEANLTVGPNVSDVRFGKAAK